MHVYCRFFVWHMRASIYADSSKINIDACHLVEESNSYPQNNIIHDKLYMIYHNKVSSRMHPRYGDDSNLKEPSPHYSTYNWVWTANPRTHSHASACHPSTYTSSDDAICKSTLINLHTTIIQCTAGMILSLLQLHKGHPPPPLPPIIKMRIPHQRRTNSRPYRLWLPDLRCTIRLRY